MYQISLYLIWPWDKSISICLSKIIYFLLFHIMETLPAPSYTLNPHLGTEGTHIFIPSPLPLRQRRQTILLLSALVFFALVFILTTNDLLGEYMEKSNISWCMKRVTLLPPFPGHVPLLPSLSFMCKNQCELWVELSIRTFDLVEQGFRFWYLILGVWLHICSLCNHFDPL